MQKHLTGSQDMLDEYSEYDLNINFYVSILRGKHKDSQTDIHTVSGELFNDRLVPSSTK